MISKLLSTFALFASVASIAQEVEIAGDILLCPNTDGTAYVVNDIPIDSYQWLVRDAFTADPYVPIDGATGPTFTYSAYEYSVKQIKLGAVVFGDVYVESNALVIDSWVFSGITTMTQDDQDISINPNDGSLMLCEGGAFNVSLMSPYNTNVQWFKDGDQIAGNTTTLEITGPGEYWVSGAPQACPNYIETSLPIVVTIDPNCQLGNKNPQRNEVSVYPNPFQSEIKFRSGLIVSNAELITMSGQVVARFSPQTTSGNLDVSGLAAGVYILKLESGKGSDHIRVIKE